MLDFWKIVGGSPLRGAADVDAALEQVACRLDALQADDLVQFADHLRKCLYSLDRKEFAEIRVELADGRVFSQTSDHFLYSRCACVLAGESTYDGVLRSRSGFERFVKTDLQSAEGLLYLAQEAFESKIGHRMRLRSDYSTEWMSNVDGWT
jgi:hypothetical protein